MGSIRTKKTARAADGESIYVSVTHPPLGREEPVRRTTCILRKPRAVSGLDCHSDNGLQGTYDGRLFYFDADLHEQPFPCYQGAPLD